MASELRDRLLRLTSPLDRRNDIMNRCRHDNRGAAFPNLVKLGTELMLNALNDHSSPHALTQRPLPGQSGPVETSASVVAEASEWTLYTLAPVCKPKGGGTTDPVSEAATSSLSLLLMHPR